jgi:hypothetical protein
MANRTAKCAVAIFASILAGTSFTIVAIGPARAADDCLTEPQGAAPQGQHWYYRTEHNTKQRCWYLRDLGDKSAQTESATDGATPAQGGEPAAARATTDDAYAELPAARPRVEPSSSVSAPRRAPVNAPAAAIAQDRGSNTAPGTTAAADSVFGPPPVVSGQRAPSGVNSSDNPSPDTSATTDADAGTEPAQEAAASSAPGAALPVPTPPAAATPTQKAVGSLQMLLLVIFGALTLAGLSGSLVYRLGRARRSAQAAKRRRDLWRSTETTQGSPWENLHSEDVDSHSEFAPRPGFSRADTRAGVADEKIERVEAFLAQLSRMSEGRPFR